MRTHVDFKFTKNWGSIEKNTVKSLDKAFARSLQDVRKVGKILGPTQTEEDAKILEDAKKLIQAEVDSQVADLKKENANLKRENAKLLKVPSNKADKAVGNRSTK